MKKDILKWSRVFFIWRDKYLSTSLIHRKYWKIYELKRNTVILRQTLPISWKLYNQHSRATFSWPTSHCLWFSKKNTVVYIRSKNSNIVDIGYGSAHGNKIKMAIPCRRRGGAAVVASLGMALYYTISTLSGSHSNWMLTLYIFFAGN